MLAFCSAADARLPVEVMVMQWIIRRESNGRWLEFVLAQDPRSTCDDVKLLGIQAPFLPQITSP